MNVSEKTAEVNVAIRRLIEAVAIGTAVVLTAGCGGGGGGSNTPGTTTAASGLSYSTTFPATENPISESGNWTNTVLNTWNAVSTVGGTPGHAVSPPSLGITDGVAMLVGPYGQNQTVTVKAYHTGGLTAAEIEIHLRMSMVPGSPDQIFTYEVDILPGSSQITLAKWTGSLGIFAPLISRPISGIADGDIFVASAIGPPSSTVITAWKNGTQILTFTDASGLTGNPGIGFDAGNQADGAAFGIKSYSVVTN